MKKKAQGKREIYTVFFAFLLIVSLAIASKFFGFHQIQTMHKMTSNIYDYPLKVSNASLTVKLDVYKIHRDMKDIVLSSSQEEFVSLVQKVNQHEIRVYENLELIKKRILGEEGLKLQGDTLKLFREWKPIRSKVIELVKNNRVSDAVSITKGEGAKHVLKLEKSSYKLYKYAKNKAENFKNEADSIFNKLEFMNYEISIGMLILFLTIVYYTIGRISKYIYKTEHLSAVLSVIRGVNQLIVREKEVEVILQESCNILTSSYAYKYAWIMIINDDNKVDNLVGTDSSDNFRIFGDKIQNGWTPHCINKLGKSFSYIKNTHDVCVECPLKKTYQNALNIELRHETKLYGYLNISISDLDINGSEIELLEEIARDIAYAMYTIKIAQKLTSSERKHRILFEGKKTVELIIDSTNGMIIDANKKASEYYGYTNNEFKKMNISNINTLSKENIKKEMILAKSQKRDEFYFKHKLANGQIRDVKVYSGPINFDNTILLYSTIYDVTEERLKDFALKKSEQQLKTLVSNLPGISYRVNNDRDWSVQFFSDNCKKLTGYEVDDFIKNKLITYNEIIYVDDREHVRNSIQNALLKQEVFEVEYRIIMANGVRKWMWERGVGIFEDGELLYIEGIILDNDERKKDEFLLIENEEKYRAIFNQAAVGVARLSLDGRWKEVNKKLCSIVGYTQEELLKLGFQDITHPDDLQADLEYVEQLLNNEIETYSMEKRYYKKNGDIVWINLTANVVRDIDNNPDYFIAIIEDITSQKNDKENLKESEKKFRAVFEQTGGYCMILNPNTSDGIPIIVDANKAACEIHGYSREDFIGRPVSDVDNKEGKLLIKKRTAEIMSGKPFFVENIHVRRDGTTFPVAVNASRIDIGDKMPFIFTTEYDITELKQAEKELKDSNNSLVQKKNELETIIQEAPNPIMVYNEDGKVILINKVWEELTGYKYSDINTINKWTQKAYSKKTSVIKEDIEKVYLNKHKIDEGEYKINTMCGDVITWQFSSAYLGVVDGKRTVISSAMDITELKHKDEMLINQSRHAAMGEMIGMIAHQWRQPIATISMDANNMLLDIALGEFNINTSEKYANNISEQTQYLSKTIDDFRNFFKTDKTISKVNIRETLDQTLSIVKDSLKNNNIKLISLFETEKAVYTYQRELMQVFVNIITNAKDALIQNKRENSQINVRVSEEDKYINIEISDNAGGIDKDILTKVFDPYFSTKDEKTGTGLGLYMCKMIVEKHFNGTIKVNNRKEGACFSVRLLKKM